MADLRDITGAPDVATTEAQDALTNHVRVLRCAEVGSVHTCVPPFSLCSICRRNTCPRIYLDEARMCFLCMQNLREKMDRQIMQMTDRLGVPTSLTPTAVASSGCPPSPVETSDAIIQDCQSDRQSLHETMESVSQAGSNVGHPPGDPVVPMDSVTQGEKRDTSDTPHDPEGSETKRSRSEEGSPPDVDMTDSGSAVQKVDVDLSSEEDIADAVEPDASEKTTTPPPSPCTPCEAPAVDPLDNSVVPTQMDTGPTLVEAKYFHLTWRNHDSGTTVYYFNNTIAAFERESFEHSGACVRMGSLLSNAPLNHAVIS